MWRFLKPALLSGTGLWPFMWYVGQGSGFILFTFCELEWSSKLNVKILDSFGEGISGGAEKAALAVKEISITEEEPISCVALGQQGGLGGKTTPIRGCPCKDPNSFKGRTPALKIFSTSDSLCLFSHSKYSLTSTSHQSPFKGKEWERHWEEWDGTPGRRQSHLRSHPKAAAYVSLGRFIFVSIEDSTMSC